MASTNFKRFDEALENILSDLEYLNNSTRYNGAQSGIYPASLHNKFAYQASAMCAGLAEMMVAKGYTVEDGTLGTTGHDHAALVAVLGNLITQYDLDQYDLIYPDPSLPDHAALVANTRTVAQLESEKLGEPFAMTFPRGTYVFKDTYTGLATTTMYLMAGAVIQPWYSVRSSAYSWTNTSGSEYRCDLANGSDPGISTPVTVYENGSPLTLGTVGSLNAGEYAYSSGRLVVRLADSADPDTKADGYITVGFTITFNSCFLPFLAQCFDLSGGGIVYPRNCGNYAPEWWGAKADGTTDCTVAIQAALDAFPTGAPSGSADIGGVLQLSTGGYLVSSGLAVHGAGISVIGSGGDTSWIIASAAVGANPVILCDSIYGATAWQSMEGFRFADFGLYTNHVGTSGIHIKQAYLRRGRLEGLNIAVASAYQAANEGSGIVDDGETDPGFSNGVTVKNCDIRGFKYGIRLTGRQGGAILENNFLQGTKALSGSAGIYVESTSTGGHYVKSNYFESWDYGIKDYGGVQSVWLYNMFEHASINTYDYDDNDTSTSTRQADLRFNNWSDEDSPLVRILCWATNRDDILSHVMAGRYTDSANLSLRDGYGYGGIKIEKDGAFNTYLLNYLSGQTDNFGQTFPLGSPYDFVDDAFNIETVKHSLNIGTTGSSLHYYTAIWAYDGSAKRIMLRVNGEHVQLPYSNPPASAGASGKAGAVTWDANYLYVCVAANTWKRAALSTW